MPIVIDINTLAPVFDFSCADHVEFSPVLDWIEAGIGVVVFGGTKYKHELMKTYRYMRLVRQLRDSGKAVSIKDKAVDEIEANIRKKMGENTCNDHHIMALLAASRCNLLCSRDSSSFRFIKDRQLYPKGSRKVRIYSSSRNRTLLKPFDLQKLANIDG